MEAKEAKKELEKAVSKKNTVKCLQLWTTIRDRSSSFTLLAGPQYELARLFADSRHFREALQVCENLLARYPDAPVALPTRLEAGRVCLELPDKRAEGIQLLKDYLDLAKRGAVGAHPDEARRLLDQLQLSALGIEEAVGEKPVMGGERWRGALAQGQPPPAASAEPMSPPSEQVPPVPLRSPITEANQIRRRAADPFAPGHAGPIRQAPPPPRSRPGSSWGTLPPGAKSSDNPQRVGVAPLLPSDPASADSPGLVPPPASASFFPNTPVPAPSTPYPEALVPEMAEQDGGGKADDFLPGFLLFDEGEAQFGGSVPPSDSLPVPRNEEDSGLVPPTPSLFPPSMSGLSTLDPERFGSPSPTAPRRPPAAPDSRPGPVGLSGGGEPGDDAYSAVLEGVFGPASPYAASAEPPLDFQLPLVLGRFPSPHEETATPPGPVRASTQENPGDPAYAPTPPLASSSDAPPPSPSRPAKETGGPPSAESPLAPSPSAPPQPKEFAFTIEPPSPSELDQQTRTLEVQKFRREQEDRQKKKEYEALLERSQYSVILPLGKRIHFEAIRHVLAEYLDINTASAGRKIRRGKGILLRDLSYDDMIEFYHALIDCPQKVLFVRQSEAIDFGLVHSMLSAQPQEEFARVATERGVFRVEWKNTKLISPGWIRETTGDEPPRGVLDVFVDAPHRHLRLHDTVFNYRSWFGAEMPPPESRLREATMEWVLQCPDAIQSHSVVLLAKREANDFQCFASTLEFDNYNRWLILNHFGEPINPARKRSKAATNFS